MAHRFPLWPQHQLIARIHFSHSLWGVVVVVGGNGAPSTLKGNKVLIDYQCRGMGQCTKAQGACPSIHPSIYSFIHSSFILQMISDCHVHCEGLGRLCRGKRGRVPALIKFILPSLQSCSFSEEEIARGKRLPKATLRVS